MKNLTFLLAAILTSFFCISFETKAFETPDSYYSKVPILDSNNSLLYTELLGLWLDNTPHNVLEDGIIRVERSSNNKMKFTFCQLLIDDKKTNGKYSATVGSSFGVSVPVIFSFKDLYFVSEKIPNTEFYSFDVLRLVGNEMHFMELDTFFGKHSTGKGKLDFETTQSFQDYIISKLRKYKNYNDIFEGDKACMGIDYSYKRYSYDLLKQNYTPNYAGLNINEKKVLREFFNRNINVTVSRKPLGNSNKPKKEIASYTPPQKNRPLEKDIPNKLSKSD